MSSLAQDSQGDLALATRNAAKGLTVVRDPATCAAQKLTNRLLLLLGEWFLDTRLGLPFLQAIAVKNPDLRVVKQIIQQVILGVPGIVAIQQLDVALGPDRRALVTLRAQCDDGAIITGGEGNAFIVKLPQESV